MRGIDWEWLWDEIVMVGCVIGMAVCAAGAGILLYLAISNG